MQFRPTQAGFGKSTRWSSANRTAVEASGATGGRIRFDSTGLAEPLHLVLRRRERQVEVEIGPDGALTLWVGSDDENNETTLSATDLYPDIPGALRSIRNLGQHPYEFYLRLGFRIAGVLPDANGRGKPDVFLAKRVGA